MKEDLFVKNGITIPGHELEITTSRAGGPGGQHVNKASTRITLRWNVLQSSALTKLQKERIMSKLASELTSDGSLIIHAAPSRSQEQNKKAALALLVKKIRKGLYLAKKRIKTQVPKGVKEKRLLEKRLIGEKKRGRRRLLD